MRPIDSMCFPFFFFLHSLCFLAGDSFVFPLVSSPLSEPIASYSRFLVCALIPGLGHCFSLASQAYNTLFLVLLSFCNVQLPSFLLFILPVSTQHSES